MQILKVPIASVALWDKNPRGIKAKDFERLKKQIKKLGVYKPLVAFKDGDHYVVLGGNMRLRALQELGVPEVDISVVDAPTQARRIEYAMSDNDRAGYYEEDALAELVYPEMEHLDLTEFKVDLGEPIDLKAVVERYGPDIDDGADNVPEVDDTPAVTRMGDLFTLGRHRLLCGDSTKVEDVARLLAGNKPGLMVTDPPYGVEYDPEWRNEAAEKGSIGYGASAVGRVTNDDRADWFDAWTLFPGGVAYTWSPPGDHVLITGAALVRAGFDIRAMIIWRKSRFAISRGAYHYQHEPCWYAVRRGAKAHWIGDRSQSTVWEIDHSKNATGHGTEKPLACMMRPITNHEGDVYDPFLGSGTTLIAAEKTGRVCYGMEIDPKYCDVIIKRYADYTGTSEDAIRATREGNG